MDKGKDFPTIDVGYYDPFTIFPGLKKEFQKRSVMSNLHWKPNSTDPVKTIDTLAMNWIEEIPKQTKPVVVDSSEYYARALDAVAESSLKFMFVHATSVDDYRSKVRPLIRAWLNDIYDNKIIKPMWCLVYLEDPSDKVSVPFKTNIFNKLSSDFNNYQNDTIERCFRIKSYYSSDTERIEAWNILITNVKSGLLEIISNKLNYYQTKKFSKDTSPEIILTYRDSIAQIYQQMGLFEDALSSYQSLLSFANLYLNISDGFSEYNVAQFPSLAGMSDEKPFFLKEYKEKTLTKMELLIYIYKKQVALLLSKNNRISLKGKTAKLFEELISASVAFVSQLHKFDAPSELKSSELSYKTIRDILGYPEFQNLLQENTQLSKENSDIIMRLLGESGNLKILFRDQIMNIAKTKGYYIQGSLSNDLLLESTDYNVTDPSLSVMLQSQETFEDHIIKLTEDIIQDFARSNHRPRAVDILSTELALIQYYKGDYQTASQILGDSFQYYKGQDWSVIGTHFLQFYIKSLEKLRDTVDNDSDNILELLLNAYTETISTKGYVSTSDKQNALLKLEKLSSLLDRSAIFEGDSIFNSINVDPVIINDKSDIYSIKVTISSAFDLKVDGLKLAISNEYNSLSFEFSEYKIEAGDSTILLSTRDIAFGTYKVERLLFTLGKLEINKVFEDDLEVRIFQQEETYHSALESETNTYLSVEIPRKRDLENDTLSLEIYASQDRLDDFSVVFYKIEKDRLSNSNKYDVLVNNVSQEYDIFSGPNEMTFNVKSSIPVSSKIVVLIPYFFPLADVGSTVLEVKFAVAFSKNGQQYTKLLTQSVDTQLTISASVEDIFKSDFLYSNFSVGPSTSNFPVRINTVDLNPYCSFKDREPSFTATTWLKKENTITFYGQVATFFYLIKKKEHAVSVEHKNEFLDLCITYTDINEECSQILKNLFGMELKQRHFRYMKYFRVFDYLFDNIKLKLNHYALSNYLKICKLDLGEFNTQVFSCIAPHDLHPLMTILSEFFQEFISEEGVYISDDVRQLAAETVKKQLEIRVPLNVVKMIHVVEFDFERKLEYCIGEAIHTKLKLETFTTWSDIYEKSTESSSKDMEEGGNSITTEKKKKKKVLFAEEEPEALSTLLKLDLNLSDNWLISGTRSLKFEVKKVYSDKPQAFDPIDIVLIPLKHGKLPLPDINITNFDDNSMHLDYKNSSETLFVSPELKKVTFAF